MSDDGESSSTVTLEDAHVQKGSTVTILCTAFGDEFAKGYAEDHGGDGQTGTWEGTVIKKAPEHKQLPGQRRWHVRFKDETKNTLVAEIDLTVIKQPENTGPPAKKIPCCTKTTRQWFSEHWWWQRQRQRQRQRWCF
jgi:hypothetical protein